VNVQYTCGDIGVVLSRTITAAKLEAFSTLLQQRITSYRTYAYMHACKMHYAQSKNSNYTVCDAFSYFSPFNSLLCSVWCGCMTTVAFSQKYTVSAAEGNIARGSRFWTQCLYTWAAPSGWHWGSCLPVPYALPPAAPSRREKNIIRALSILPVHCRSVKFT